MKIKTKYNIGDVIYVVKDEAKIDKQGQIKINWYVVKKHINFIMVGYDGKNLGIRYGYGLYWEGDCFATGAEAQAECNRRNKNEKPL